jgi:hypothetical protein
MSLTTGVSLLNTGVPLTAGAYLLSALSSPSVPVTASTLSNPSVSGNPLQVSGNPLQVRGHPLHVSGKP